MVHKKKERAPIVIYQADLDRAYKKVKEYQDLLKRGKTSEQIFKDMLRLILVEKQ
jgi:hypothetical protein